MFRSCTGPFNCNCLWVVALIAAFLYLRVLLVINLLVHLMHHLLTGISSQELPLLQQRTEQPLAKTTSTLTWMLLGQSMECLYMSLIWTLLMINPGENRVRISLECQLPVCCLSKVVSRVPCGFGGGDGWHWLYDWLLGTFINSNSYSNEVSPISILSKFIAIIRTCLILQTGVIFLQLNLDNRTQVLNKRREVVTMYLWLP